MFGFFPPEVLEALLTAWRYVYLAMPLWLPIFLSIAVFNTWLKYKRSIFWSKQEKILLELRLPREITKSPAAMEVVLNAFYQTGGEATWFDRLWKGQTRPWFSLEIASFGGNIKFFVWTWTKFRNVLEANIYSQYPGLEVHEASDYTLPVSYNPEKSNLWACEFALTAADPYPIKTYVDYGLHETLTKEEQKVDPLTSILEFLGSITDGHEIWMQIIIRAHKKEQRKPGTWFEKTDAWKDQAAVEIKKIVEKFKPEDKDKFGRPPTKGETETIAALERSIGKMPFDCGMRAIYIADKDKFNPTNIGGVAGGMKQYSSPNLNGFKPTGWFTIFDFPWQDYYGYGRKKEWMKKAVLEEYKKRSFFFSPYKGKKILSKPFVLNSEELATIFHFPGSVATTPTLERVPSRKAEPPPNLPL